MVIRANGVCTIAPDNMSSYVPKTLSVGKREGNSWAKEYFPEHSSFPEQENYLVWDVQLSEDFGLTKLPANNIFVNIYLFIFMYLFF